MKQINKMQNENKIKTNINITTINKINANSKNNKTKTHQKLNIK